MQLGTDPEFFLRKKSGELLPAFHFLSAPSPDYAVPYWDGFQAEFRTNPRDVAAAQLDEIKAGIRALAKAASIQDAAISHESVVEIPDSMLSTSPAEHVQLGCMPSQNIYHMKGKCVEDGRKLLERFAGGHVHFDIAKALEAAHNRARATTGAVKTLDAMLGVPMVSIAAGWDNPKRREYYGLAGEHRLPKHGLEYRTLSNFWCVAPELARFVYAVGEEAVRIGQTGWRGVVNASDAEVVCAINKSDVPLARKLLERNKAFWVETFERVGLDAPQAWDLTMRGPGAIGVDPTKIAENWGAA